MSVVVRMEMPSGCDKCPFMWGNCIIDEKDECYGRVHYNDVVVRISGNKYAVRKDRPSWCPIVCSLPEGHGRLVDTRDIDSMMEDASSTSDESGLYSLVYRDDLDFDGLPTIVPAERRTNDGTD